MILSGFTGWKPVPPLIPWQEAHSVMEADFFFNLQKVVGVVKMALRLLTEEAHGSDSVSP